MVAPQKSKTAPVPPLTGGPFAHWAKDMLSGFLVFLIALPLCIAISLASGYPAVAGIFTAVIGGMLAPLISNSEMTIKGPAAGLIVIAVNCVLEFKAMVPADAVNGADYEAYRLALGVGVAAGVVQVCFGLMRAGVLADFFPKAAVHGMLAAIGIIIFGKQIHTMLGVSLPPEAKEPFEQLAHIPDSIAHINPEIAFIGFLSLLILFALPFIPFKFVKRIPSQMLVLIIAIPLGYYFDLEHDHMYSFAGHDYRITEKMLVPVPSSLLSAVTFPNFAGLTTGIGIKYVIMFSLVGTIESMASAKAIDLLDRWKRKTDFNRDVLAIGIGNTIAACIGGLPMISEIVRSKANIDNGARTRLANAFHGLFLLLFVAFLPGLIHRIPLAALAAMLVFTGYRLASPKEFVHTWHTGREQLVIFVSTLIGVVMIDLLVGIVAGIVIKLLIHVFNGAPMKALFLPQLSVLPNESEPGKVSVVVRDAAVFSNWILVKRQLQRLAEARTVEVDLTSARLVDHTVMEQLFELQDEFAQEGRCLVIVGLDDHRALSHHPAAARSTKK